MDNLRSMARSQLAWRSIAAARHGLEDDAARYQSVANLLEGKGTMADNIRLAIEELRTAAVPHNEVADLLATLIGEAPRHG